MNKTFALSVAAGLIALFATSNGYAQTAESLVQTRDFNFTPNGNVDLTFAKFNDMGGTRILTSVEVTVDYTKIDGSLSVDNDSAEAGSISVAHSIRGDLTVASGGVSLMNTTGNSIGVNVVASSTGGTTLGATSGDPTNAYNDTSPASDHWVFTPADTNASNSGTIFSGFQNSYVGTDNFVLNFAALQTSDINGLGGVNYALVNSSIEGFVTVRYNYDVIPEPSSMLFGLGSVGLLFFRRRR
ncbi:MAG: choice-of-anchor E domain-containing protein [Luteolibacter sp.]